MLPGAVIEHHGGTVEKFIGDAVMAVFGVPVLHEDDALRAVRAAAGLREEIAVLNRELEADFGATVSVRTGVNTGQVVTGTDERLATGDAVNLAARLEQAAAPGEIVIGPQTWRLVRGAVTAEPLEPLRLKGKSQPVTAYRLLQVRGDVDPRARAGGAPLVGRQPAADARRRVRERGGRAFVRPVHDSGHGRGGQVAADSGVPARHRCPGGDRALPVVRAGHHVLAGGLDGQAAARPRARVPRRR